MGVQNFTASIVTDYSYITEPPIFADIGEGTILISNTTLSVDATSDYVKADRSFTVNMTDVHIESLAEPFSDFNGISDFSEIVTNVVNTLVAVIRNRAESLINGGEQYPIDKKIEAIINKVMNLVKFPIQLGDNLYLEGLLYDNIITSRNMMKIPLDVALR